MKKEVINFLSLFLGVVCGGYGVFLFLDGINTTPVNTAKVLFSIALFGMGVALIFNYKG